MSYYFSKKIESGFDEAVEQVTAKLAEHGFGIITRIDMSKTFKEKLNVDFQRYLILGACNPNFAYQALRIENKIGTMLPCNIRMPQFETWPRILAGRSGVRHGHGRPAPP